ncbi:MAG: addiction module toxin, HicA family [Gammaproteobacteria bacterium]|nr:addiction module toxin, HicA family [Gammaproteobacteria bacterium]
MTRQNKLYEKMRANPRDWRVEQLKHLADAYGLVYRQPGTSHVTFRHPDGAKLTVPAHSPIKPVYIKKFLRLLQEGIGD